MLVRDAGLQERPMAATGLFDIERGMARRVARTARPCTIIVALATQEWARGTVRSRFTCPTRATA
jgi:hypothetical protein